MSLTPIGQTPKHRNLSSHLAAALRQHRSERTVVGPITPVRQTQIHPAKAALETDDTKIIQSTVKLVPSCMFIHGAFKSREKDPNFAVDERRYGCEGTESKICKESMVLPKTSERPPVVRLTTLDPQEDLKRWIMTSNDALNGTQEVPQISFVSDRRYTFDMLLNGLGLAIQEIRYECTHQRGLIEYAGRKPYRRLLGSEKNKPKRLDVEAASFADASREALEKALRKAVDELDLMRGKNAKYSKQVMGLEEEAAKEGDWAEIADLLRLGAVNKDWVDKECRLD